MGMFTFALLYSVFYIFTLSLFFIFFKLHNFTASFPQAPLSVLFQFVSTYVRTSWALKLLFIQLAGLPPVFVFFFKFNCLFYVLSTASFFVQLLTFINLFLGMIFYVQIFKQTTKRYNLDLFKRGVKDAKLIKQQTNTSAESHYFFYKCFLYFTFFMSCGFIFFFDFYIIAGYTVM